ncbi:MAG: WYL domain-containing protein [Chloroflexi bacterium]|nr:MAG: WYL domain-containing protein [Chloroflexota bacterium]
MLDIPHGEEGRRLQENTRVARILEIIWLVMSRPKHWTRRGLAEHFEVSERTIGADLEIIRHGLLFDVRREHGGGYYFVQVPQLPSVTYSVPEALALILAAEAGRHIAGIAQADLSSAIARLESVFPGELGRMVRQQTSANRDRHLTHREQMLQTCAHAALRRKRLRVTYATAYRGGAESTREVDPFAVFPYERSWHLVGHCHLRNGVRVFKIDRMRAVQELQESFPVPRDFDLNEFLASGWGLMRGLDAPVEAVELRFSAVAAPWVVDEQWHPSQEIESYPDGGAVLRLNIQVSAEFQRWVFGFGREVQVLAPETLREWVQAEAQAILAATYAASATYERPG